MKDVWGRLLDIVWRLLSKLPLKALYALSDILLFPITFHIIRYRRRLVETQLNDCFPEKTISERRRTERRFYHFFCDYMVETIKLRSMPPKRMARHVEWIGLEELQQHMKLHDHHFAFVYIGHYCNWEWLASFPMHLHDDFAGAQIYHPLKNAYVDRIFLNMRRQFGGECIPMKETLRHILGMRKQGKRPVVGFIADQCPKWESMHQWCRFLHHDTSFYIGTEKLGKMLGAEVYYLRVTRPRRGYYRAELLHVADADKSIPDYELTDTYARMLEKDIRQEPHLWLWTHKRWKRTKEMWLKKKEKK